jgi:hypothetical protein
VHRVLCGTAGCGAILSERSQCVNLLADASQMLFSTDIPRAAVTTRPFHGSTTADQGDIRVMESCDCVAERVRCAACVAEVGYHVTEAGAYTRSRWSST